MIILMGHSGRRRSWSWRASWNTYYRPTMPMILVGGSPRGRLGVFGAISRDIRSDHCGHADRSESATGRRRVRGGPGSRWRHLRGDPLGARAAPECRIDRAQAIEAVRDGLADGMADCRAHGRVIEVRQLVTAMRQGEPTRDIAKLALRYRRNGVVGFDIAGPEKGYPASRFLESFQLLRRNNAYYTIHAGEADGCPSIWEAVQVCGANRIGHGVAIIENIQQDERGKEGSETSRRTSSISRSRSRCARRPMFRPVPWPRSPSIQSIDWIGLASA